ncbi:MAG: EboA domain-containing protein [Rhodospirillales bacterium]|nr:EboA domain-containing protein [Rhodospirillales bacterium]
MTQDEITDCLIAIAERHMDGDDMKRLLRDALPAALDKVAPLAPAGPADLTGEEKEMLQEAGMAAPHLVRCADLVRAALVLGALRRTPEDERERLVRELFHHADAAEQQAILRTLILLPNAGKFLAVAEEGARSGARNVFEAIACENLYPARHFPEDEFQRLVHKAEALGFPHKRIAGLSERQGRRLM